MVCATHRLEILCPALEDSEDKIKDLLCLTHWERSFKFKSLPDIPRVPILPIDPGMSVCKSTRFHLADVMSVQGKATVKKEPVVSMKSETVPKEEGGEASKKRKFENMGELEFSNLEPTEAVGKISLFTQSVMEHVARSFKEI